MADGGSRAAASPGFSRPATASRAAEIASRDASIRSCAGPHRREQHLHRGLRRGQRRLIRAPGAGDPVAHHRHRGGAVGQLRGRERHRVLVAVMPQAAIGHAGQQPEIDFGVITAGRQLAAARLAVAIRGDLRRLAERARGGRGGILAADHRRGQFRPARLAEIVLRADRPAAGRARDVHGRHRVRSPVMPMSPGGHGWPGPPARSGDAGPAPAAPGPGNSAPGRTAASAR